MKKIILLSFAVGGFFMVSSCSKEKQLTNRLTGTWLVDLVVTVTKVNGVSTETDSSTTENTLEFKKDNSGTASTSGQGSLNIPASFTWSNTDVVLTIVDDDAPNKIYDFDVVDCSCKKSFEMSGIETEEISGDSYTYDRTYFAVKTD